MFEQRLMAIDDAILETFFGGSNQPSICCTHQYGVQTASGGHLAEALARAGRVVLVNPRDAGNSSPARQPDELTMRRLVEDLETLRRNLLGEERWVFAGTSTGGMVGLLYALRYPEALAGLIVNGSAPSWRFAEDASSVYNSRHAAHTEAEEARTLLLAPNAPPETEQHWAEVVLGLSLHKKELLPAFLPQRSGGIARARLAAVRDEIRGSNLYDVTDRLGEIRVPTLITCGRYDNQCPIGQSELMHTRIPHSEFVVFEESGHFPFFEEPEKFRATIQRFIVEHVMASPISE